MNFIYLENSNKIFLCFIIIINVLGFITCGCKVEFDSQDDNVLTFIITDVSGAGVLQFNNKNFTFNSINTTYVYNITLSGGEINGNAIVTYSGGVCQTTVRLTPILSSLSNSVPASGGLVTIKGRYFQVFDLFSPIPIYINSSDNICDIYDSQTMICNLGSGAGANKSLTVSIDGKTSNGISFSFQPPTITKIIPTQLRTITIQGASLNEPISVKIASGGQAIACDVTKINNFNEVICDLTKSIPEPFDQPKLVLTVDNQEISSPYQGFIPVLTPSPSKSLENSGSDGESQADALAKGLKIAAGCVFAVSGIVAAVSLIYYHNKKPYPIPVGQQKSSII